MQTQHPSATTGRIGRSDPTAGVKRLALNEYELAERWRVSVKTLRRWRQEALGCPFMKLGARVSYAIADIEAFERRVSRCSTSVRAYQ
jgi:hypothetical protein